ncbi:cytochrome P450 [Jatrophihabitans sp. YIM 134969]
MTDTVVPIRRTTPATREPALPPGAPLPRLVQTVVFGRFRPAFTRWLRRRHGDVYSIRIMPGRDFVVVADPALVKTVFTGSTSVLHAGEGNNILEPAMGDRSVLLVDEADHLRIRKLLMPAFHGAPLNGYREVVTRVAKENVERWPVGRTFAAHDFTTEVTRDIILTVVFGVTDPARLAALTPPVDRIVNASLLVTLGLQSAKLKVLPPWRGYAGVAAELDELLYAEIAERRTVPDLAERTDVLSQLIRQRDAGDGLSDKEIRDNLITLLLAGHETTATSLAWTFHELARRPDVQARARQAADEGDDAYLEAVLKEALRVRPVIWEVARLTKEPFLVGEHLVPAGVRIMPAIGLVQLDPENFPDPHRFDPSRFLGQNPAPNTWIPFGGGTRRCLGAAFSLMESVIILREALLRYELTAPDPRPEAALPRNVTLTPAKGCRLVARRR